jgi:NAD(P)-dependent dehydrogenase (short-subunit alcohol dehydrogenase family)
MASRVEGKIALVTGAGSEGGIGRATAARLAQQGAVTHLSGIDGAAEACATEIGCGARAIELDVTSEARWDRVMNDILAAEGRIDILVNNAGIAMVCTIKALTLPDLTNVMAVDMTSVFLGTHRVVAAMRAAGKGGSIVNIASIGGLIGVPSTSAYAASKVGVRSFSKTIAIETAKDDIRVNTVLPGPIWTKMFEVSADGHVERYESIKARIPLGILGEPVDVASHLFSVTGSRPLSQTVPIPINTHDLRKCVPVCDRFS